MTVVLAIDKASVSKVPSTSTFPEISRLAKVPTPVVVMLLEPLSMAPKPDVMLPLLRAPVVTILLLPAAGAAPRLVSAAPALVALVPPLAMGSVPDTSVVRTIAPRVISCPLNVK